MAIFGNDNILATVANLYPIQFGLRYNLPEDGIVTSMSFYGKSITGKTPVVCLAIYSTIAPYSLLGYTESIDTPTLGWHTLNMVSPINLTAGDYFLTFSIQYEGIEEQTFTIYRGTITPGITDARIYSSDNNSGIIPPSNPFDTPTLSNIKVEASIYATYIPPQVADFSATPLSGIYPLTVQFTDTSTNTPTSWLWSFGDGQTSTLQNPSHTYTRSGFFTVTLTATNDAGSDIKIKTNYIHALPKRHNLFFYEQAT